MFLYLLTMFDNLFFTFFNYYKPTYKKKARTIATNYITLLEISLLFLLRVFLSKFFAQFNILSMSSSGAWTLFVIASIAIWFKNWMQYAGRTLTVKKAKGYKKVDIQKTNMFAYWLVPFTCFALGIIAINFF